MAEPRLPCRTPAGGRGGVTKIPEREFNTVRGAIPDVLREAPVAFSELPKAVVKARLSDDDLDKLGSVGWHVTTVKLEMEVRGELAWVLGRSPQMAARVERA